MTNGIMCPRYKEEVLKMFHEYNETFIKENEQILAYIGANTGLDFKKDPFVAFISVADCLNMQSRNGLELPEWAKDIFPYKMMPLLTDLYNRYSIGTEIQLQLGGGLVMQRVLDIFKMGKRKMYLSAGHDVTLMMLLGALGVPRPVAIPEPTGSVILELHNVSGTSIVKAYSLKSSSYNQFETLQMSCGLNECILSDFEVMTSNLTVSDYHRLCNEISPDFKMNISSTLVAIGGAPVPLY
ncbi:hypothetical protein O3M35_013296 [Rhynocoris fuscipes]|uniref:Acid phosphatase n=1 Tax=Rhynocoris fuscipes TaxID=488301 RepID=A0AAW1CIY8_9HEMI